MKRIIKERVEHFGLSDKERVKADFSEIGIIGCGRVGQQLAILFASRGMNVIFIELNEQLIHKAYKDIEIELDDRIAHWGLTNSEKRSILARISGTLNYHDLKNCDLVIETITTKSKLSAIEKHHKIFKKIEEHVSSKTIIASNSATLSITEMASGLEHPERCVIMHFSTTARESTLVEVARSIYTTEQVCQNVRKFITLLGKNYVRISESLGLVSVRTFIPMINEACNILTEMVSNIKDIDFIARKSMLLPMGPFELADRIGIDRLIRWLDNLYDEYGDKKFKAAPILRRLFRAGYYGRKVGRGFYYYDEHGHKIGIAYPHALSKSICDN